MFRNYCNGGKRPQYRTRINSEDDRDSWAFIAKEQSSGGGKGLVAGKLLRAGQSDQMSRMGTGEFD